MNALPPGGSWICTSSLQLTGEDNRSRGSFWDAVLETVLAKARERSTASKIEGDLVARWNDAQPYGSGSISLRYLVHGYAGNDQGLRVADITLELALAHCYTNSLMREHRS